MNDSSSFADAVNRIVLRVACTEGHESPSKQHATSAADNTGPLTVPELAELSLLCSKKGSEEGGFDTVEGEQLLALLELLDRHINHAVSANLIPRALAVLQEEDSPSRASASLDQVGSSDVCAVLCRVR